MKKVLIFLSALTMGYTANSQISFEHSYSTNNWMDLVKLEGDGYKYIGIDTLTKNIKLYNTDHTLWKTVITATYPGQSVSLNVQGTSKYLFNSDDKIEFIVAYNGPGSADTIKIINEDGVNVFTIPVAYFAQIKQVDGLWKLFAFIYHFTTPAYAHTDIYGLPGVYSGLRVMNPKENIIEMELSPNPLESEAVLRYKLPDNTHVASLAIYNNMGIMVRQMTITDQFDNVLISKGELPTGIYTYRIVDGEVGNSAKFEIK